jgi:hypothetical protein
VLHQWRYHRRRLAHSTVRGGAELAVSAAPREPTATAHSELAPDFTRTDVAGRACVWRLPRKIVLLTSGRPGVRPASTRLRPSLCSKYGSEGLRSLASP